MRWDAAAYPGGRRAAALRRAAPIEARQGESAAAVGSDGRGDAGDRDGRGARPKDRRGRGRGRLRLTRGLPADAHADSKGPGRGGGLRRAGGGRPGRCGLGGGHFAVLWHKPHCCLARRDPHEIPRGCGAGGCAARIHWAVCSVRYGRQRGADIRRG